MLYNLHKATGVSLLIVAIVRLTWRFMQPQPALPADMPRWQQRAAKSNFALLYVLMVAMPVSGLLMSLLNGHSVSFYGLFTIQALAQKHFLGFIAHEAHHLLSYILVAAITLHMLAAFYHYFIRKDNVLQSMLPLWLGGEQESLTRTRIPEGKGI
jgi:cytochrome b561